MCKVLERKIRNILVGKVFKLLSLYPRNRSQTSDGDGWFVSSSQRTDLLDIHTANSSNGTGIKWAGLEADHSTPHNAKIQKKWNLISSPHTLSWPIQEKIFLRTGKAVRCQCSHYIIFIVNLFININQLDALNFIISLFQASTCFEQKYSLSGGQNCTIQSLVSSHL